MTKPPFDAHVMLHDGPYTYVLNIKGGEAVEVVTVREAGSRTRELERAVFPTMHLAADGSMATAVANAPEYAKCASISYFAAWKRKAPQT